MGGIVPFGYRLESRKLLVDVTEAEKVRQIFQIYLELRSLPKLVVKLEELEITSRVRTYAGNKAVGGQSFRTGTLSHLLSNRVYIGEVKHHKQYYPGEHQPIITVDMFESVRAELAKRCTRSATTNRQSNALLKGLLFDSLGNRMTPVYSRKAGVRNRYYQSCILARGQKDKAGVVDRVPAREIEQVVTAALAYRLPTPDQVHEEDASTVPWTTHIERIDVLKNVLNVRLKSTDPTTNTNDGKSTVMETIIIPWTKPAMNRRRQVLNRDNATTDHRPMRSETRSRLLKGIAQRRIWMESLISSRTESIASIAKQHNLSEKSVRSTLSLAILAPEIIDAAIDGRLPRSLTTTQMIDLPSDWNKQRKALGPV